MSAGAVFVLLVAIVLIAVVVLALTGNLAFLGARGSDPQRHGVPGEGAPGDPAEGQPRHTKVDLDQNMQDEPRGEPVDRAP